MGASSDLPKKDPDEKCNGRLKHRRGYCGKPAGYGVPGKTEGRCKWHGGYVRRWVRNSCSKVGVVIDFDHLSQGGQGTHIGLIDITAKPGFTLASRTYTNRSFRSDRTCRSYTSAI